MVFVVVMTIVAHISDLLLVHCLLNLHYGSVYSSSLDSNLRVSYLSTLMVEQA